MTPLCPLNAALNRAVDPSWGDDRGREGAGDLAAEGGAPAGEGEALRVSLRPGRPRAGAAPSPCRRGPFGPPSTGGRYRPGGQDEQRREELTT